MIHNRAVTHVALVGAGNISETHARACREIPGVKIVAVHGANHARAARLAALYGGVAYDDLPALLAHRPLDAVIIGSPSGVHADQGAAAAAAGLHVLVEKPIDVSVGAADRLIAAAADAGVRLGVLYQDRTQPSFVRLRALLVSGALGRPLLATARVKWYRAPEYYTGSRWRGTRALDGGGALINQGIHTIDLLVWLLGPVRRVLGGSATLLHEIEVEDTTLAILEFESGVRASFEATTAAYPGYPRRVELTTTEGTIVLEHDRVIAARRRTRHESQRLVSRGIRRPGAPAADRGFHRGHRRAARPALQRRRGPPQRRGSRSDLRERPHRPGGGSQVTSMPRVVSMRS